MLTEEYFGIFGGEDDPRAAEDIDVGTIELRLMKSRVNSIYLSSPIKINHLNASLLTNERASLTAPVQDDTIQDYKAKWLILSMRHLAPPVVYLDAPLTYLAEGQANKFFTGMSGVNSAEFEDPSVINYFVIEPRYEAERDENGSPIKVRN